MSLIQCKPHCKLSWHSERDTSPQKTMRRNGHTHATSNATWRISTSFQGLRNPKWISLKLYSHKTIIVPPFWVRETFRKRAKTIAPLLLCSLIHPSSRWADLVRFVIYKSAWIQQVHHYFLQTFSLSSETLGKWDGSEGKGSCCQDWWNEFNPWNQHGGMKELL